MNRRRPAAMVRLYAILLRLLPADVRRADGDEIVEAFRSLWEEEASPTQRLALTVRVFGRLPKALVMEWMDAFGVLGSSRMERSKAMKGWGSHFRHALRTLSKAPGFTLTSVGLIALGVGAVTTIFTMVDHVLLRPLPYPAVERLVTVENGSHSGVSYEGFRAEPGFDVWAAARTETGNLTGEGEPIRLDWAAVSEDFFSLFGARPVLGRLFVKDDFEAPEVVVLTYDTWRTLFGGDPDIVGRTVRVDGSAFTVIGVVGKDFEEPTAVVSEDVALYRPIDWRDESYRSAGFHVLSVAARLSSGVVLDEVQPRFDALAERLARANPDELMDRNGEWMPLPVRGLQDSSVREVREGLNLLLGAVGLLLLVACLNVAHLFLARGLGRVQEMAVRRALGAGTAGLVRQLLAESLVVGAAGAAGGIALAALALDRVLAANPEMLPRVASITVDVRVAAFACVISVVTAVVFGLLPTLRTIGQDLARELKGASRASTAGRGTRRLRGALVVAEVAFSLILVAQAGLLFRSFMNVQAHDTGFRPAGVWTLPLTPSGVETPEEYRGAMDEVLASLASLPGVEAAAYGLTMPFAFTGGGRCCWRRAMREVDGVPDESLRLMLHPVSERYFETLGIELVAGTGWDASSDMQVPTPAVINERLAIDRFGSAEGALGHVFGPPDGLRLRVAGVARDVRHYGLDQEDEPFAYVPLAVLPFSIPLAHMAVRLRGEAPEGMAQTLREAVWRVQPDMPVPDVKPMQVSIDASMTGRRFDSAIYGAFGAAALLLAAAGLYGTLLYTVRQQWRELGIRIALGAARAQLERQVVGRGLRLAALGSVFGLVGAFWVGRRLEERLYEVDGSDPLALGIAALTLLVTAAAASWIPARRAARVDPLETLRVE